jgi:hypothetical protein
MPGVLKRGRANVVYLHYLFRQHDINSGDTTPRIELKIVHDQLDAHERYVGAQTNALVRLGKLIKKNQRIATLAEERCNTLEHLFGKNLKAAVREREVGKTEVAVRKLAPKVVELFSRVTEHPHGTSGFIDDMPKKIRPSLETEEWLERLLEAPKPVSTPAVRERILRVLEHYEEARSNIAWFKRYLGWFKQAGESTQGAVASMRVLKSFFAQLDKKI